MFKDDLDSMVDDLKTNVSWIKIHVGSHKLASLPKNQNWDGSRTESDCESDEELKKQNTKFSKLFAPKKKDRSGKTAKSYIKHGFDADGLGLRFFRKIILF